MSRELVWHDEAEFLGVRVRVHLFDPAEVDTWTDPAARLLPAFGSEPPRLEAAGDQCPDFRVGALRVRPDALFIHGEGLICLTRGDVRLRDRDSWRRLFRIDAMLVALATAMAVAGQRQRPTAAMLREAGALLQFDPASAVLECLATHIGDACRHWQTPQVNPVQLASFCEPRLRTLPGVRAAAPAVATT